MTAWMRAAPAVAALLFATCLALLSRPPSTGEARFERPLLPRKEVLLAVGAGYRELVVDYYWIQLLQAVYAANDPDAALAIYDYARLITDLEPRFRPVYVFAGATLPWLRDDGTWANTRESSELLRRGIAEYPDVPMLSILLAQNLIAENDLAGAARVIDAAARQPDAPAFLGPLAFKLYSQVGRPEQANQLMEAMLATAADPLMRDASSRRLKELRLELELKQVRAAVAAFKEQNGRPPADLEELVRHRHLTRLPVDPFGRELRLDPTGAPTLIGERIDEPEEEP
jgi:hypothetical protein